MSKRNKAAAKPAAAVATFTSHSMFVEFHEAGKPARTTDQRRQLWKLPSGDVGVVFRGAVHPCLPKGDGKTVVCKPTGDGVDKDECDALTREALGLPTSEKAAKPAADGEVNPEIAGILAKLATLDPKVLKALAAAV